MVMTRVISLPQGFFHVVMKLPMSLPHGFFHYSTGNLFCLWVLYSINSLHKIDNGNYLSSVKSNLLFHECKARVKILI